MNSRKIGLDPESPSASPERAGSPSRSPERAGSPSRSPERAGSPSRSPERAASPSRSPERAASPSRSPERVGSPSRSETGNDKATHGFSLSDLSLRRPRVVLQNLRHLKPGTSFRLHDEQWVPVTFGKRKRKQTNKETRSLKDIIDCLNQKKPPRTSTEVSEHPNGLSSWPQIPEKRNKNNSRPPVSKTTEETSSGEHQLEIQETSACDARLQEQEMPPQSNSPRSVSCDMKKDESFVEAKSPTKQDKTSQKNSKTLPKQNRKRKNKEPPSRILKMSEFLSESTSHDSSKQLNHAHQNSSDSKNSISVEEEQSKNLLAKLKKFRLSNVSCEEPLLLKNRPSLSKKPQELEDDELKKLEELKSIWLKDDKPKSIKEEHKEINIQRRNNSVKLFEKRLKTVEAEKSHFQKLVRHLERQRGEIEYAKVKALTELEQLRKEKESQATEHKRSKAGIDNLRKEIQLKKRYSEEIEKKLQHEKRRNSKMARNIEDLTKINTRLQNQLKQCECLQNQQTPGSSITESQKYKQQCECLQEELQKNKTLVTELQNEKERLLNHNSELLEKVVTFQCDINILKEKCARSEEDNLLISQLEAERKELCSRNCELLEKVSAFEKMLDDVKKAHSLLIDEPAKNQVKTKECQSQSQLDLKQQEIDELKKEVAYLKYTEGVTYTENDHLKSTIKSLKFKKPSLIKGYDDSKISLEVAPDSNCVNPRCENVKENPLADSALQEKTAEVVNLQQELQIAKEIILEEKQQFEMEKRRFHEKMAENKLSEALHMKIQVAKMRALAHLQQNPQVLTEEKMKRISKLLSQPAKCSQVDAATQVEISTYTHQKLVNASTQTTVEPTGKWNLFKISDCTKIVQKPRELHPEEDKHNKTTVDKVKAQSETASSGKSQKSGEKSLANCQMLKRQDEGKMRSSSKDLEGKEFPGGKSLEEENAKLTHKIKTLELAFAEEHNKVLKLLKDNQSLINSICTLKNNFAHLHKFFELWHRSKQHQENGKNAEKAVNDDSHECNMLVLSDNYEKLQVDCKKLMEFYSDLQIKHSHLYIEVARLKSEIH